MKRGKKTSNESFSWWTTCFSFAPDQLWQEVSLKQRLAANHGDRDTRLMSPLAPMGSLEPELEVIDLIGPLDYDRLMTNRPPSLACPFQTLSRGS